MGKTTLLSLAGLVALVGTTGCAKAEYVGNSAKGFWSDQPAEISPTQAYQKAQPHLDTTWEVRCAKVRKNDEWCDKLPLDHMMRKGKWYYVTRISYPYKAHSAFLSYAVKINADNGRGHSLGERVIWRQRRDRSRR